MSRSPGRKIKGSNEKVSAQNPPKKTGILKNIRTPHRCCVWASRSWSWRTRLRPSPCRTAAPPCKPSRPPLVRTGGLDTECRGCPGSSRDSPMAWRGRTPRGNLLEISPDWVNGDMMAWFSSVWLGVLAPPQLDYLLECVSQTSDALVSIPCSTIEESPLKKMAPLMQLRTCFIIQ